VTIEPIRGESRSDDGILVYRAEKRTSQVTGRYTSVQLTLEFESDIVPSAVRAFLGALGHDVEGTIARAKMEVWSARKAEEGWLVRIGSEGGKIQFFLSVCLKRPPLPQAIDLFASELEQRFPGHNPWQKLYPALIPAPRRP